MHKATSGRRVDSGVHRHKTMVLISETITNKTTHHSSGFTTILYTSKLQRTIWGHGHNINWSEMTGFGWVIYKTVWHTVAAVCILLPFYIVYSLL